MATDAERLAAMEVEVRVLKEHRLNDEADITALEKIIAIQDADKKSKDLLYKVFKYLIVTIGWCGTTFLAWYNHGK